MEKVSYAIVSVLIAVLILGCVSVVKANLSELRGDRDSVYYYEHTLLHKEPVGDDYNATIHYVNIAPIVVKPVPVAAPVVNTNSSTNSSNNSTNSS